MAQHIKQNQTVKVYHESSLPFAGGPGSDKVTTPGTSRRAKTVRLSVYLPPELEYGYFEVHEVEKAVEIAAGMQERGLAHVFVFEKAN